MPKHTVMRRTPAHAAPTYTIVIGITFPWFDDPADTNAVAPELLLLLEQLLRHMLPDAGQAMFWLQAYGKQVPAELPGAHMPEQNHPHACDCAPARKNMLRSAWSASLDMAWC